ncbi:MAG: hypothetical protein K6T78_13805 [Alicyclobacillus sp.]|nr:hypothetical protein [Alicyclobacillus sp.]
MTDGTYSSNREPVQWQAGIPSEPASGADAGEGGQLTDVVLVGESIHGGHSTTCGAAATSVNALATNDKLTRNAVIRRRNLLTS